MDYVHMQPPADNSAMVEGVQMNAYVATWCMSQYDGMILLATEATILNLSGSGWLKHHATGWRDRALRENSQ
jgi:hypothetical protein